ncbi:MAG TPA: hypothetical protein VFN35_14990, partial [Ktedonobacteraceae bacterium]|nr:hypothetical protein [Ktedonobacteraceae bacterium]
TGPSHTRIASLLWRSRAGHSANQEKRLRAPSNKPDHSMNKPDQILERAIRFKAGVVQTT